MLKLCCGAAEAAEHSGSFVVEVGEAGPEAEAEAAFQNTNANNYKSSDKHTLCLIKPTGFGLILDSCAGPVALEAIHPPGPGEGAFSSLCDCMPADACLHKGT